MSRAVEASYGMLRRYTKETLGHQGYLKYEVNSDTDPVQRMIRWGRRAELEVNKLQLLTWIADVYGVQAQKYTTHYEAALDEEEQRSRVHRGQRDANRSFDLRS